MDRETERVDPSKPADARLGMDKLKHLITRHKDGSITLWDHSLKQWVRTRALTYGQWQNLDLMRRGQVARHFNRLKERTPAGGV